LADTKRLGVPVKPRVDPEPKAAKAGLPAREWRNWLMPIAVLAAASVALVSDGALFRESGQLAAVVIVLCLGLVLTVSRWSRVRVLLSSRLGLLAVVDGAVLVFSAVLSVYHWASIREVLKAAALGEAFLLGAALIDREALRDRFLVLFYWWSVVAAGAGSVLYIVGMRWPQSWLGSYAVRTLATSTNRLSAFFGYANAFAAFLLVPIAMGVALAWRGGRRGTAALVGLIIPLFAMQLAASRWGYVVLGLVLTAMLILGMRLAAKGGFRRMRAAVVTCAVLAVAGASMLMPGWTVSSSAPDIGERFTDIGAEVRNTDPVTSSIGGRIAMIRDALHYGAAYPVLGSGPGTYSSTYFRFRSTNFFAADPHSQAMLWLTETGGIGFAAQTLLMLAVLGLVWIAAVRDAGRDQLLVGAAVGITGVLAHAMLDWDFQSYFLPLMVAVLCGVAVSALAGHDTWLLRPWRRAPAGVQTASRVVGKPHMDWRSLTIAGTSLCIALAALSMTASLVAGKGIAAYEAGATADADRFFSISQRLNSLNAEYPYLRAKTNVAQPGGDSAPPVDQAVRDGFERAVALNPWYIKYQIEQARYLLGRGDTESVAVYENLTRIDPGDPGTFTSLAWAYHVLYQNDAKAMQSLDQAFAVDETYYEAWLVLGRIQEAKGETSEAIAAYWKAVKGNRADVQALGRLGNLYDQSGNPAGAARAAFELLQRTPESADAKSAFAAVGMSITLGRVTLEGRQVSLSWTTGGRRVAESYRLVLTRPNVEDTVVAEGIATGQVSFQASIAQVVPSGIFRLRLYAMAPVALAGVEGPWVAWAESDPLVLKDP
jgi:tetratricopeptide (TPR) repeat protein/O-antigen ligase